MFQMDHKHNNHITRTIRQIVGKQSTLRHDPAGIDGSDKLGHNVRLVAGSAVVSAENIPCSVLQYNGLSGTLSTTIGRLKKLEDMYVGDTTANSTLTFHP
jgi:hypothetical protein